MRTTIESCAAWLLDKIQVAGARLDPEMLQWPGGIAIVLFFWLCAAVRWPRRGSAPPLPLAATALEGQHRQNAEDSAR